MKILQYIHIFVANISPPPARPSVGSSGGVSQSDENSDLGRICELSRFPISIITTSSLYYLITQQQLRREESSLFDDPINTPSTYYVALSGMYPAGNRRPDE